MNVASKDLCEELYKLSRWEVENDSPHWAKSNYSGAWRTIPTKDYEGHELADEAGAGQYFDHMPAYDLGYLLRKLPKHIDLTLVIKQNGKYIIVSDLPDNVEADTPEDAACLLAIKLHLEGIIRP